MKTCDSMCVGTQMFLSRVTLFKVKECSIEICLQW